MFYPFFFYFPQVSTNREFVFIVYCNIDKYKKSIY